MVMGAPQHITNSRVTLGARHEVPPVTEWQIRRCLYGFNDWRSLDKDEVYKDEKIGQKH